MTKSRFRYWLGVGISSGLLVTFFKIGSRQNQHDVAHPAHGNGMSIYDSLYISEQSLEPDQNLRDPGYILTSFLSSNDDDSLISAEVMLRIEAQQAWEWMNAGKAILLDLRSYDEYQAYHPKGAQSFSAARMPDLEETFPNNALVYILMHWGNDNLAALMREFRQRGYLQLCVLDMASTRPGQYKMNDWEQEQLPVERKNVFQLGDAKITLEKYMVLSDSLGHEKALAHFPKPTVELLLQYRPQIIGRFGYDEDNEEFRSRLGEIESTVSAATLAHNKLWIGFSFYEEEGSEGYGGIGFYDLDTGEIGVLRHPALVNHSVRDLMITDAMIYVATIDEFELSREVGNGLVMIDRKTLQVSALVPPRASVVWHRDGGENAAVFYDKSISEILADRRFVSKNVEGWNPNDLIAALNLGLERYMIETAERERQREAYYGDAVSSHFDKILK
jgi:rhodanese-related sulfurtransferase